MTAAGWSQDFATRIINVHWGGVVAVAADDNGNIFCLKSGVAAAKDEPPLGLGWQHVAGPLIDSPSGNKVSLCGSSYGLVGGKQPVFVMVGYGGGKSGLGHIYASPNGFKWSEVFTLKKEQPDRNSNTTIFAVVWDGTFFWAAGNQTIIRTGTDWTDGDPQSIAIDLLFRSSDGVSWSEAARHETIFEDASVPGYVAPEYTKGLLVNHCSPLVKDALGNNAPDGIYGYDLSTDTLIQPSNVMTMDYLFGGISYGKPSGIIVKGTGFTPAVGNPSFPVLSVARVGAYWVAGGGGGQPPKSEAALLVRSSTEEGFIWRSLNPPGTGQIPTMVGGNAGL